MRKVKSILCWGLFLGTSLLVVVAVAWAISRAVYPTEAQRAAIAQLEQQSRYAGENAFALLWTLEHDVPADQLSAVMAEDIRRFSEPIGSSERRARSSAAQYADLSPSAEDREQFCFPIDEDCLAQVRENLAASSALVERNEKLLDRIEQIHDYEYLRSEFPHHLKAMVPPYRTATMLLTRRAVDFASGREEEAVAATCRDLASWRRFVPLSDTLTMRSVAMAYALRYGRALAGMLAEWPVDRGLPEPCAEALAAPEPPEISLCETVRGEFAVVANSIRQLGEPNDQKNWVDLLLERLFFDAEATVGMAAEAFSDHCSEKERERIVADRPALPETQNHGMLRFACVGNFAGCVTQSLSWPNHASYRNNVQDYGAQLRVLATLAWMRRHAGEGLSPSTLLAERPESLASPAREIEYGPEGKTLRVALYDDAVDPYWSISLPSGLHSAEGN